MIYQLQVWKLYTEGTESNNTFMWLCEVWGGNSVINYANLILMLYGKIPQGMIRGMNDTNLI